MNISIDELYIQIISGSGGSPPYTYTISPDNTWLTLDQGGRLYGIPNISGLYTYSIFVTDSSKCNGEMNIVLNVV